MTESITKGQVVAIHALVATLGLDEATYRLLLRSRFGVETSLALSPEQAAQLIDELKVKAGQRRRPRTVAPAGLVPRRARTWPVPAPRDGATAGGTITEPQQAYLDRLFAELGWDQPRRDGLCRRVLGRPWPQTNADVTALLKILRPMARRACPEDTRRAAPAAELDA